MLNKIYTETEEKMKKAVESVQKELASIRTGKATTALLDGIRVEYYGNMVPLNQVASVSAPEPKLLVIQPWEKKMIEGISRSILKSDLGLNPTSDGNLIRLAIPPLTEERRRDLVKLVKKLAEEGKISVRNVRREGNEALDSAEKKKEISEDDNRKSQERIQKLTDKYIEAIDKVVKAKEVEIMEV
ncbi:MAG: ribosome recycling factor [candidate division Zixibacteria bacterium RBG_16_40_9]|nr:MAG: ribosome recycling factor [candidate division Zixibacteria bacterium RBG_16_40_9]